MERYEWVLAVSALLGASCRAPVPEAGNKGGTGPESAVAATVPSPAATATARPNNPFIAGGKLEDFAYFTGTLTDGGIDGCDAGSCASQGKLVDGGTETVTATYVQLDDCAQLNGFQPSIYTVRRSLADGGTEDLCQGQTYNSTAHERAQCNEDKLKTLLNHKALAVPGRWKSDGAYETQVSGANVYTLACTSGVTAKCAHWGYPPWGTHGNTSLMPYYKSCVRAARATYLATSLGTPFTCNGPQMDIYDKLGIQTKNNDGGLPFESAWTENEVACIKQPRYAGCDNELSAAPWDAGCVDPSGPTGAWDAGSTVLLSVLSRQNDAGAKCVSDPTNCPSSP